jgi:cysteinyl-tRNA synthetase
MHNGLMQSGKQSGKVGGQHDRHGDVPASGAASAARSEDDQIANKLAGSAGAESVKMAVFAHHHPEAVRFFLLSTHYRSPIDFSLENISNTEKSMEGFYRMFETFERVTGRSFYDLAEPTKREETTDLSSLPDELHKTVADLRDRFWEAMDDDFNTAGAIGLLFELRRAINAALAQSPPLATGGLVTLLTLFKELSNVLGVFRRPVQKESGADDAFVHGLMDLVLELRKEARVEKNWAVADKIRR